MKCITHSNIRRLKLVNSEGFTEVYPPPPLPTNISAHTNFFLKNSLKGLHDQALFHSGVICQYHLLNKKYAIEKLWNNIFIHLKCHTSLLTHKILTTWMYWFSQFMDKNSHSNVNANSNFIYSAYIFSSNNYIDVLLTYCMLIKSKSYHFRVIIL